ncbi:MAG: hypothetical protein VW683_01340 [Betaproteobacteria bacterium]
MSDIVTTFNERYDDLGRWSSTVFEVGDREGLALLRDDEHTGAVLYPTVIELTEQAGLDYTTVLNMFVHSWSEQLCEPAVKKGRTVEDRSENELFS